MTQKWTPEKLGRLLAELGCMEPWSCHICEVEPVCRLVGLCRYFSKLLDGLNEKGGETKVSTIPTTLDEALDALDVLLPDEEREYIKNGEEKVMSAYHHGLGQRIRNEWGLWHNSQLKQHFVNLGLWHADDMSGVILISYWRKLHGVPLDVEGQVKHYLDYWKERAVKE